MSTRLSTARIKVARLTLAQRKLARCFHTRRIEERGSEHHSAALGSTLLSLRPMHQLPGLPYKYSALEPFINRDIIETHYTQHHASYVNKLNAAEEKLFLANTKGDIKSVVDLLPIIKMNGGGHINHCILWNNLTDKGVDPSKELEKAVKENFGSWGDMQGQLTAASMEIQGSGWAWLCYDKKLLRMRVATCKNEDHLETSTGLIPLLGIDVWEHAYYLQFRHARSEYCKNLLNVINWEDVSSRYKEATKYVTYPSIPS